MDVVVVESPTKAKTINKYLGDRYKVLPSYGHVRDLPEKDGSVLPEEDFKILYELLPEKKKWEIFFKVQSGRTQYLKPGDRIEASIRSADGRVDLGVQRNRIVAEA